MKPRVKMLALSLTGACNFACKYCYAANHVCTEMSETTAVLALHLAPRDETFVLQFTGGEPLLNFVRLQQVVAIVEKEKLPARLQLQTNASLLTDEIACYLYEHKVAIGVSLDGKPEVNDTLRKTGDGRGATREILRGIEVLRRNGIATGLTCVVTADNVDKLEGIVEFAYFLGNVRKIGFDLLRKQGRGEKLEPPDAAAMAAAMQRVRAKSELMKKLTGLEVKLAQVERAENIACGREQCFGHCYAMNGEAAFVEPGGKIYACSSLIGYPDFFLGDVEQGIDSVRCRKIAENIRESMHLCRECEAFAACGGGCFARWLGNGYVRREQGECVLKRAAIEWNKTKVGVLT